MRTIEDSLKILNDTLDSLIKGRSLKQPLDTDDFPEVLTDTIERFNRLNFEITEINGFLLQLTRGNLDADPPSRANYLSSPAKEIHSQLTSLCINLEMLITGKMVSKLYYPGKLYELYNCLIDKVSQALIRSGDYEIDWEGGVSSWRYHQILGAINQLSIIIIEVDSQGNIVFANPPAKQVFKDIDRLPYGEIIPLCEDALMGYLCTFIEYKETVSFPVLYELHDYSQGIWYKVTSDQVKMADGSLGLLHVIDDISEWKRNEMRLHKSAVIDALTGAYTRFAGIQKLDEMLRNRDTHKNCVAFADLDDLKQINDVYGHNEGDDALKCLVRILKDCIRDTDWVVRYGGDEFLIYFMDCSEKETAKVIERMYKRLEEVNSKSEKPYNLSFSIGVQEITDEIAGKEELIYLVDKKMYKSKKAKKSKMKN